MNFDKHEVSRTLIKKLSLQFTGHKGKEQNGWFVIDGRKILRVTMPKGRDGLPAGTAHSIRNQVKLSNHEFSDLINCPMSGSDYKRIIREKMGRGIL